MCFICHIFGDWNPVFSPEQMFSFCFLDAFSQLENDLTHCLSSQRFFLQSILVVKYLSGTVFSCCCNMILYIFCFFWPVFCSDIGLIVLYISTFRTWWRQWVVMAADHCYSWWRWWSDHTHWQVRLQIVVEIFSANCMRIFLLNCSFVLASICWFCVFYCYPSFSPWHGSLHSDFRAVFLCWFCGFYYYLSFSSSST
jgi:hypothetical protein